MSITICDRYLVKHLRQKERTAKENENVGSQTQASCLSLISNRKEIVRYRKKVVDECE